MATPASDIAFTPSVKAVQSRRGSRKAHAAREASGGFHTEVTPDLAAFLAEVDTAYLATASAAGQPYAQHRGGPKGFIRALDEHTLAFADFRGNRQYISLGNVAADDRVALILMDYPNRARLKILAHLKVRDLAADPALAAALALPGYKAVAERAFLLTLHAFDWNCAQHITPRYTAPEIAAAVAPLRERIAALEAESQALRAAAREQGR